MNKYNKEHYSDPTPHDAMKNIAREERAAAMEPIHIVILGEPVAQGRPRFSRHAGYVSTYDPGKSRKYKQRIFDEIWAQIATRKMKLHYHYARIEKTGDDSVNKAVCEVIESWGYKVAQNKSFIMVLL